MGRKQRESKFYNTLKKSKLTPPKSTFGFVWPILYVLLIIYFIAMLNEKKCRGLCLPLIPFILQMILNLSWSPVFFGLQKIRWALLINIGMIILTIITMILTQQINPRLNYLLVPYIIWISFAAYLNLYLVLAN